MAFASWALLCPATPPLDFLTPDQRLSTAVEAYRAIWTQEGARIAGALERATGLEFPPAPIAAIVGNGPPMAAYGGRTIRLRAGYSPDYKRATLVHELGHVLSFALPRTAELDDHRILYLFLYDVWTDLYGCAFADRMVAIERRIPGAYDYDAAWTWALAMTREERRARLAALRGQPAGVAPQAAQSRSSGGGSKSASVSGRRDTLIAR
jgi:hypothetical protein